MAQEINCFSSRETDCFDGFSQIEDLLEPTKQRDWRIGERLLSDRTFQRMIERIARKNTRGTTIDWEDAAQTAQMKVFRQAQAGKFARGGVEDCYHWAAVVAKNTIIDLVRKENKQRWTSLDRSLPGTDLLLSDTIADDFELWDAVERADLVMQAIEAIRILDRRYPQRGYLKLWQGKLQGKTQTQLVADLGITQGAVSKRWKELKERLAEALGLLSAQAIEREQQKVAKHTHRRRSSQQW